MLLRLRFLLLLLACTLAAHAQNLLTSPRTAAEGQVYRLSVDNARKAALGQPYEPDDAWFNNRVATFPIHRSGNSPIPADLAPGHYLVSKVLGNQMEWTYLQVPAYSVFIEEDYVHLMIKVVDFAGNVVRDAQVTVGDVSMPYDTATQTYKAGPELHQGLLEVHWAGAIQFYQLTKSHQIHATKRSQQYPFWKRWLWWPVKGWIIMPVVRTVMLPYDIVRSVVKKQPHGWLGWAWYRANRNYQRIRHAIERKRPVKFMLCSQPKYRQGDTVKVKAYITDRWGHPIRQPLKLTCNDRDGQLRTLATVKPVLPGCYVAQFRLEDSLQLQLGEHVSLYWNPIRKRTKVTQESPYGYTSIVWAGQSIRRTIDLPTTSFMYEDYELDEMEFTMRAEHPKHWKGKEAVLLLEAKDKNGLTMPDARVDLLVSNGQVLHWAGDHAYLPDTLWHWSGNLDPAGETRLVIPLERFTTAAFSYSVHAECHTSNNERKTEDLQMTYVHEDEEIMVRRHADSLHIALVRMGKEVPTAASVVLNPRGYEGYPRTLNLSLPTDIVIPINCSSITVKTEKSSLSWAPDQSNSKLQVFGQHVGDTLQIVASTSDTTAFTYHLWEGEVEIATGIAKRWVYVKPANPKSNYYLTIHRILDGVPSVQDFGYNWRKNDLKVDWEGPATIYPGMTADMKVRVRSQKDRPIRKANVTAYAINSRFQDYAPPRLPSASRSAPYRAINVDWNETYNPGRNGRKPLVYQNWAHRLRLDTVPWYNFLYPDREIYRYDHPIEEGKTEIAPFAVIGGAIQPVQIVYIDYDPVYFAWASPEVPYSFPVTPGWHRVELRLMDWGVRIDSFFVRKGFKNILSLDPEHPSAKVFAMKMANTPVGGEMNIIQSRSFGFRSAGGGRPAFIHSGDRMFRAEAYRGIAGPVKSVRKMEIEVVDDFKYDFDFEPGFEFDFGPKLLKMRSLVPGQLPTQFVYRPSQLVEHRPWVKDSIIAQWRRDRNRQPVASVWDWRSGRHLNHPGRLVMHLELKAKPASRIEYMAFLNDTANTMYVIPFYNLRQTSVPLGKWKVALLLNDDQFIEMDSLLMQPFGQNYYHFSFDSTQVQDSFSVSHAKQIKRLFPKIETAPPLTATSNGGERFHTYKSVERGKNTRHVVGRISDAKTTEALPGAVIFCKGSNVGTVAAEDGSFAFDIPIDTDTLEVSYLGYGRQQFRWRGELRLDIGLEEEDVTLSSVLIRENVVRYHTDAMSSAVFSTDVISPAQMSYSYAAGSLSSDMLLSPMAGTFAPNMSLELTVADNNGATAMLPEFPRELLDELAGKTVIRKDFRDWAVWEPALRSDKKGLAAFRVKFPEDITRWDAYALVVDRRGRTGITRSFIRSWKPIAGRLAMPRFLYEGDTAMVIGKLQNYTGDTLQMRRRFKQGEEVLVERAGNCGPVILDTLAVTPKAQADSFTLTYVVDKADGYGDGEQWGVRVFPKGVEQSDGVFATLLGDTSLQVGSFDQTRGLVKVHVANKLESVLIRETESLGGYEHLCNEQLASKLIALLSEQLLFKAVDSAWHGDTAVHKVLALFEKRLDPHAQGYGWWPGMPTETWVSMHVTSALAQAQSLGYKFKIPFLNWGSGLLNRLRPNAPQSNLQVLQYAQQIDSTMDIRKHIEGLDTAKHWGVADKIAIMELRQKAHLSVDIDSLLRMSTRDMYGLQYWGANGGRWSFLEGDLVSTLAALRVLRRSGATTQTMIPVISYILSKRTSHGWGNTYTTALVLQTLVPLIGQASISGKPKLLLTVNGLKMQPLRDTSFTMAPSGTLQVDKEGGSLTFIAAYQEWFNPDPPRLDDLFAIETYFLEDGKRVDKLTAGKPVTLNVAVDVKRTSEYMMLEVPIPASCSYMGKTGGYYDSYYGNYRECFRQKTVMYFRHLAQGKYNFQISLLPRYTGSYTVNATRIENMYFTVLAGQNEIERIKVQ